MNRRKKTYQERLFGAACLKLTLESTGADASAVSIYQETLTDLELSDAEVDAFVASNRDAILSALTKARRPKESPP